MRSGPLRRPVAVLGLLVLLPTAWLTATGQLAARDAGIRAIATLIGVLLVNRLVNWGVRRSQQAMVRRVMAERAHGEAGGESRGEG